MAETKKPAAKSAAVKKAAAPKKAAPAKEAPAKVEAAPKAAPAKKVSKGNKKRTVSTRLLDKYESEMKKALMEEFKYSSIMQVPHLEKIVINVGVGDALTDNKALDTKSLFVEFACTNSSIVL